MHRYHKYAATAMWPISVVLFVMGIFEKDPTVRYNIYAIGVLVALVAVTLTCLAALEIVVARVMIREIQVSREKLARSMAVALADELEARGSHGSLHQIR